MITTPATAGDGAPFVTIENLRKTFGEKVALSDVNWQIPRGRISGLLGPNGAGKTTLFRLLMGILRCDSGTLRIDGRDCFEDRVLVKRLVGSCLTNLSTIHTSPVAKSSN